VVEGQPVGFDESDLTDVEILCYYAYSPLYAGDFDARKSLLDGRCGLAVSPKTVTLNAGQKQQFTASPSSITVTWSATCGSIDATTGIYTASNGAGSCTVRATSSADTSVSATATVTVTAPSNIQLVSRNSGMFAQVSVASACSPNVDFDQKQSTTFGPYNDQTRSLSLNCLSPGGFLGSISDSESASASQNSNVTQNSVTGTLTITGTVAASASATLSCSIPSTSCPNHGSQGTGSSSSISVDFDVLGTAPQPYGLTETVTGGPCSALLQNRVTFATTFLSDGQSGTIQPGNYTFRAGCGAGTPDSGSPLTRTSNFTFTLGN
jgi:hypothetical protein